MRVVDALLPAMMMALVGCSVGDPAAAELADADAPSRVVPLVVVERAVGASGAARQEATAHFVRARGAALDAAAFKLTGAALDLPAPGACTTGDRDLGGPAQAVELVSAGIVALEASAARVVLGPREIPDPVGLVAGTVYAGRAGELFGDAPATHGLDPVVLTVSGSLDIEPFAATAVPPRTPESVRAIAGASDEVAVEWVGDDRASTIVVYIDALTSSGRRIARCAFADDEGHAVLAASALGGELPATVVVHRLARQPLGARGGTTQGELRIDVSRAALVTRGRG